MVKIEHIELGEFPLLLAPMEDVSDPPFRALCKKQGADMMYTEFISVEGLIRDATKSLQKLDIYDYERPIGVQIFGAELDSMMRAAEIVEAAQPEVLDINYGCPVQKVVCKIPNLSSHFSGYASSFCLYIRYYRHCANAFTDNPFDYSYHSKPLQDHLF